MAEHGDDDHGESGMADLKSHERTFEAFVRMVTWGIGISLGVLVFLALANS
jgi:hypothetical protein